MKNNQIGCSILTKYFLARIVQMRRYFLTMCTKPLHKEKNIKQMSCYRQEKGRSMVEMLGVLAIIGVLSVGSIAGYSKAMMKYKLNKQAHQLSHLINIMDIYKNEWEVLGKNGDFVQLVPYYQKLGEIPQEMIKDNTSYIYDAFNSRIFLRTNGCIPPNPCTGTTIHIRMSANEQFDICQNVFHTAKELSASLHTLGIGKTPKNSDSETLSQTFVGDRRCTKNNSCIKDLSLDEMYNLCKYCDTESSNCFFHMGFAFTS